MTKPEILRGLASTLRRVAILNGPRDYVPSEAELSVERRPQIESAEACEAGAEAIERTSMLEDAAFHFLTCSFHRHRHSKCESCIAFERALRGDAIDG